LHNLSQEGALALDLRPYQIVIFGKAGCEKCKMLNKRVDKILENSEWQDFKKVYLDIMTEDGLIEFCNAECINPQRIPAFTVKKFDPERERYEFIMNKNPGSHDVVYGSTKLYTYLGIQTDYSSTGTITPKMIQHILLEAKKKTDT